MADILTGSGLQKLVGSANNRCFACGPNNPIGLHLHFQLDDDGRIHTRFVPGPWHEGWEGVVHGGILLTLLDEAMAYVLYSVGLKAVTARMETRFRAGVRQGDLLTVEARTTSTRARTR